jgi:hypothetical protein
LKILADLNKLTAWCKDNELFLNIDKCKTITFSRSRHPIEFPYMLGQMVLERVHSINNLGVIMDQRMCFTEHLNVMLIRRASGKFRDPYTLKALWCAQTLNMRVMFGLEGQFIRFALRGLGWTDLPPYEDICALLHIDTLFKRRTVACLFIFNILSGKVSSPSLLSMMYVIAPWYQTRGGDFLRVRFYRKNYGVYEPFNCAMRRFNEVFRLFDFHLTIEQFVNRVKLVL